jgi:hypothetical protein
MCAPTSSQRRCIIDDEDGGDVPMEPRISHWHSSAATKHGRQTNRNYVTGKSPRISRPTRPAGWLAGVSLLMGQELAFGVEEGKENEKTYSLFIIQDNVLAQPVSIRCQQMILPPYSPTPGTIYTVVLHKLWTSS